jgi:hypothetical protein
MKGYKIQAADRNTVRDATGKAIQADQLAALLADHPHADELAEMIEGRYRPENLHSNGDIDDSFNPDALMLVRVTHEVVNPSRADLAEQAGFIKPHWSYLAESYQSYVKRLTRWRDGYTAEPQTADKSFMIKVESTKRRMMRDRKFAKAMRRKYAEL